MPSKISHNQGFDHVGVLKNPDGSIREILIVESKFSHKGEFRLSQTKTKGQQMSKRWIKKTIAEMRRNDDPNIRNTADILTYNEEKCVLRGNVLDPKGINSWKKPTETVNKQYQSSTRTRAPPTP